MEPLRAGEETVRRLLESLHEGLGAWDRRGVLFYANPKLGDLLGCEPAALAGRPVRGLVVPEERERFDRWQRETGGTGAACEFSLLAGDGRRVPTLQSIRPLEEGGGFALITDLTPIKQTERRLRLAQFTIDRAVEAVFWMDYDGVIRYVSDSASALLRYPRERLIGMTVHDVSPDFPRAAYRASWERARREGSLRLEDRVVRSDGVPVPVEVTVNYLEYEGQEMLISVARDISERKRAEAELFHNAFHDSLTGLPNRALFMDRLQHCMERSRRSGAPFAVLFLDVDRFKLVNDSLGHVAGDALLVQIATRLRGRLRVPDTVARIGGDEFLILLEDTSIGEALHVAGRLCAAFREPFDVSGQEVFSTVSVGIGTSDGVEEQLDLAADEIVRDADIAMYRSKAKGGAAVTLFDREMHLVAVSRLELETDLRRALHEGQFELHYQPVVDTASGEPVWLEALLRWRHPQRGQVPPVEFIAAAEETDLIGPLSWWVLEQGCREMRGFQAAAGEALPLKLSVNLSGKLVLHPELVERVRGALGTSGLDPSRLSLEITESVLLERSVAMAAVLAELECLGVEVVIDDFGAGHSSLHYLSELPVQTVKIDRSFVSRTDQGTKSREILRSVVELVHNLEMRVVAEGVETAEQLALLRSLGCEYLQGFLLSRPLDEAATLAYLRAAPDRRAGWLGG